MAIRIGRTPGLWCASLGVVAACAVFSDGAVELAACISKGASDMSVADSTSEIRCRVRSGRTVTVILAPPSHAGKLADVAALQRLGVPAEAIYYHGPDTPSVGQPRGLGSVNVYDGHFADNRMFSNSSALGRVEIATLMAKTGDEFRLRLHRRSDGAIQVTGLEVGMR